MTFRSSSIFVCPKYDTEKEQLQEKGYLRKKNGNFDLKVIIGTADNISREAQNDLAGALMVLMKCPKRF